MALNAEEKYAQKKFEQEREHYSRLTPTQKEIKQLKKELKHKDRQLDEIWFACQDYATGEINEGLFLDRIMRLVSYPR